MGPESEDQKEYFCCFAEPGADPLTVKMDLMQLLPLEDGWFKRLAPRFKASRTESLRQLETTRYSWQDVRFTSPLCFFRLLLPLPILLSPLTTSFFYSYHYSLQPVHNHACSQSSK
jgi:hypothetical protein